MSSATADAADAAAVKARWDVVKAEEKAERAARRGMNGDGGRASGLLDEGGARPCPGLARAVKLQKRAGTVGFDWNDRKAVIAKIREEVDGIGSCAGRVRTLRTGS